MKWHTNSISFRTRLKLRKSISKMSKLSTKNTQIRLKRRLLSLRRSSLDSRTKTLSSGRSLNPIARKYQRRLLSLIPSIQRSRSMSMNSNQKSKSLLKKQNFSKRIAPVQHVPKILVINSGRKKSQKLPHPPSRSIQNYPLSMKSRIRLDQILKSRIKYRRLSRTNNITYYLTINDSSRFQKIWHLKEVTWEKCNQVVPIWQKQRQLLKPMPNKKIHYRNRDFF